MLYQSNGESRTKLKAVPRKAAVKGGKGRRFQVDLEPRDVLAGDELFAELAKFGFSGEPFRAQMAVLTIERFIMKKLAEGCQIDLDLVSFVPRLSGALSVRDVDPESDGLYVQGAVTGRAKVRHAIRDKVEAVNVLAKKFIRIYNLFDEATQQFDEISVDHTLSIVGHDIPIDITRPDEGFWLEKRSGHRNRKPRPVQKAEILETHAHDAKIVFREPIPRGKYTLVVGTRCGEGGDYKLRRTGHPVAVV